MSRLLSIVKKKINRKTCAIIKEAQRLISGGVDYWIESYVFLFSSLLAYDDVEQQYVDFLTRNCLLDEADLQSS